MPPGCGCRAIPPGCNHEELAALQQSLGSRPVWLAAHATLRELPQILEAHRSALRLLHRLLLVVALDDYGGLAAARGQLRSLGLSVADWDNGEEPDDYNQVLLADSDDLGLWYRLSPVALIAGQPGSRRAGPVAAGCGGAWIGAAARAGHPCPPRSL